MNFIRLIHADTVRLPMSFASLQFILRVWLHMDDVCRYILLMLNITAGEYEICSCCAGVSQIAQGTLWKGSKVWHHIVAVFLALL